MEAKLLTKLLACEILGTLPDASYSSLSLDDLTQLYRMSQKHDVAHLVADALKKANALPKGKPEETFMKQYTTAIFRSEGFLHTVEEIRSAFCENHIKFILLKGAAIRRYYPEMWMRTSCDIDILIKSEDVERASEVFTAKLSYEKGARLTHDVAFDTPGKVHIELHFDTIENYVFDSASKILSQIWDYAVRVGDTDEYELKDEMLYFYHIAHAAKHFKIGGCGIRPVIDQWVLQKNIDISGGSEFVKKAGLEKFEAILVDLTKIWFEDEEYSDKLKDVEEYILDGGVYGSSKSILKLRTVKMGKLGYIKNRIFLSYEVMKLKYPVLKKHKWLMPVLTFFRPFDLLFHGRAKDIANELTAVIDVDDNVARKYADVISNAGLD